MGECNYCTLKRLRKAAKRKGWKVTLLLAVQGEHVLDPPGYDVFIHPKSVSEDELRADQRSQFIESAQSKYWRAWLWAIGDHCEC